MQPVDDSFELIQNESEETSSSQFLQTTSTADEIATAAPTTEDQQEEDLNIVSPPLPPPTITQGASSQPVLKAPVSREKEKNTTILEKEKSKLTTSPKKKIQIYSPSSRLLTTTQCRVADVREWEARKERAKYENDIWWELRKPHPTAKVNPSTASKLFCTTTAYDSAKRSKHIPQNVDSPPPAVSSPEKIKINEKSHLLTPTNAVKRGGWKVEPPPKPEQPNLVLEARNTGPVVPSKLNQETTTFQLSSWKYKQQKEQAEIQPRAVSPGTKKVSMVSPHLLDLNKNLKAGARSKVQGSNNDPRESGWKNSFAKSPIPAIDLSVPGGNRRTSIVKQHYQSPGGTIYSEEIDEGSFPNSGEEGDRDRVHMELNFEDDEISAAPTNHLTTTTTTMDVVEAPIVTTAAATTAITTDTATATTVTTTTTVVSHTIDMVVDEEEKLELEI